jgi:hypothetical protein
VLLCAAMVAPAQAQTKPELIEGYVVTADIEALAPEMKAPSKAAPEAQAVMGSLKTTAKLSSRFTLAQDLSRQEILSTDFLLPAGSVVMHKAGDRFYVIADPKQKTYVVMDAADLLTGLEGGAGIVNTQYQAKVVHTSERRDIAGYPCKKSILTVTYVSAIPFENDRILVQQQNDIEIWHTAHLVSSAAMDHFFFKFQQDKTGLCKKTVSEEIGFPMEIRFVVTQQGGKKADQVQPGSFHYLVSEVKQEKKLDAGIFTLPPPGYKKLERNPYFAAAAGAK